MLKAFLVRLVLFTSVLTLSFPALAQSTATIQGTVADQSGAVVTGAKVILRNQGTGAEREAITDSKGAYECAGLPVGVYRVEGRADAFEAQGSNDVTLEWSQTAHHNF